MSKLRKSAQGEECLVRLPHVCSFDSETTVLAHLPDGSGGKMGGKSADIHSVVSCYACHQVLDGHVKPPPGMSREEVLLAAYEGQQRTLDLFVRKGLVKV